VAALSIEQRIHFGDGDAKELRDCYFAPMVREFVGLSTDVAKVLKYPMVGL